MFSHKTFVCFPGCFGIVSKEMQSEGGVTILKSQILDLKIRQELSVDHKQVKDLIESTFRTVTFSDQTEHLLVKRLRSSDAFVPELSLVAGYNGKIVGHIIITKVKIQGEKRRYTSLSLAPLSVLPEFQNQGIGTQLIRAAHKLVREMGFSSIVVVGHSKFYSRFGYEKASKYGIEFPFDAPDENCMVIELKENGLTGVSGKVVYPDEFYSI